MTARKASWYLRKRVLEVDKTYASGSDLLDIVRALLPPKTT